MRCTRDMGSPRTSATSRPPTRRSCVSEGPARSTGAPGVRGRISATPSCVHWTSRKRSPRPRNPPRNDAERRAARWYRLHGYRILDTNVWLGGGELDIVARRGRCVVFCEVKSKTGDGFGDPLEAVHGVKAHRVRRAAEAWLCPHPQTRGPVGRFAAPAVRAG